MGILTIPVRRKIGTLFVITAASLTSACGSERIPAATSRQISVSAKAVDINTASVSELSELPGIGEGTARKIVEFRTANGPFGRPEHLLLVDGISERKYRAIRRYVKVS